MKKLLLLSILLITFYNCSKDEPTPEEPILEQEIVEIVKLDTKTTTIETSSNTVNEVTENNLTVEETTETENLKVGDILVQGATQENPDGFARKITSIKKINEKLVFETKQAKIDEVYEELTIRSPITVDYSKDPIVLNNEYTSSKTANTSETEVEFEYDKSKNEYSYKVAFKEKSGSINGEIKFEGSLKIENQVSEFIYNIRPYTDKVFYIENGMKLTYINSMTTKGTFEKKAQYIVSARKHGYFEIGLIFWS